MVNWKSLFGDRLLNQPVVVTGGAGFIGSHLCRALVELGAKVVVLDDLSQGFKENIAGLKLEFIQQSLLNRGVVDRVVKGRRWVFHLAALGSVPRSVAEPELFGRVNIDGTLNLLESARQGGVERVIFAASSSAYGANPIPWTEMMAPMPSSPYAGTKVAAEAIIRAYANCYAIDGVSLRYFNIFGARQNGNSAYAAVIAAFATAIMKGESPVIYGDGTQSRDFTPVENAVYANLLGALNETRLNGEVYNVGCGARVSVNELAGRMLAYFGREDLKPKYLPARAGELPHSLADIRKIGEVLGYRPIVDFETGLKETLDWYLTAGR